MNDRLLNKLSKPVERWIKANRHYIESVEVPSYILVSNSTGARTSISCERFEGLLKRFKLDTHEALHTDRVHVLFISQCEGYLTYFAVVPEKPAPRLLSAPANTPAVG